VAILAQRYDPAVAVETLTEHPENPRHGRLDVIENSIEHNGFYGAVLVQQSSGFVIVGNHRLRAARTRGEPTVPVIYLDVDDDRARRIMLADNRTNDLAGYGDVELAALLTELAESSLALEGTGFGQDDLTDVLARIAPVDLDELADRWGSEMRDEDGLVALTLRLRSEVARALTERLFATGLTDDTGRVCALLGIEAPEGPATAPRPARPGT
jgi:hypothetical protein